MHRLQVKASPNGFGATMVRVFWPPRSHTKVITLEDVAQNYLNTASADYFNVVEESDETDNTSTDHFTVTEVVIGWCWIIIIILLIVITILLGLRFYRK